MEKGQHCLIMIVLHCGKHKTVHRIGGFVDFRSQKKKIIIGIANNIFWT